MIGRALKIVMKPHNLVLSTMMISFLAWSLPVENIRRGFELKESLTSQSIIIIFLWYFMIYTFSKYAFFLGSRLKKNEKLDSISDDSYYKYITILSTIGVGFVYLTIIKSNPDVFLSVFQNRGNILKEILYENYETGLHSLRYVSILGGAFALYRIIDAKKVTISDVLNITLLLMTAFISSRLSIILSIIVFLGILTHRNQKITLKSLIILVIVSFTILTAANYLRNGNFYKEKYNIDNPIVMNISEIITYVGTPFQTSVSIANSANSMYSNGDLNNIMYYLVPTYLHEILQIKSNPSYDYREFINIEDSLTTNSALTHLYSSMGGVSFPFMLIIVVSFAFLSGVFSTYSSMLFIVHYLICYCFAEIWRIYMFNTGIIHILILTIIVILFLNLFIKTQTESRQLNVDH